MNRRRLVDIFGGATVGACIALGVAWLLHGSSAGPAPSDEGSSGAVTPSDNELAHQTATAHGTASPALAQLTHAQLLARATALDAQVRQQASALARAHNQEATPKRGVDLSQVPVYPPNPVTLAEIVTRCAVVVDSPPIVMGQEPPDQAALEEALGVTPKEAIAAADALRRLRSRYYKDLQSIYAEATGEPAAAGSLTSGWAMLEDLQSKEGAPPRALYQRMAQERAGLVDPPTDSRSLSAYEQGFRLTTTLGDEYQMLLAQSLGAKRAHELRAAHGGWPWGRFTVNGCPKP